MKNQPAIAAPTRRYRQRARAASAAETHEKIVTVFRDLLQRGWFEDITIEQVARKAGVSGQTVIRRFGGKTGLLREASRRLDQDVVGRRSAATPGAVREILTVLVEDYEHDGDLVVRLLAQEERHPPLHRVLENGRTHHREWLAEVFAPALEGLRGGARKHRLDALVAATDVYVWKLLRRDLGLSAAAVTDILVALTHGALEAPAFLKENGR